MATIHRICWLLCGVILLLALSGCSRRPERIDSMSQAEKSEALPLSGPQGILQYDADLALTVSDPEVAAARAIQVAEANGGHLVSYYASSKSGQGDVVLAIAVPPDRFKEVKAVLELIFQAEQTMTSVILSTNQAPGKFSQIRMRFSSGSAASSVGESAIRIQALETGSPPGSETADWRPVRTFQQAFSVFAGIFLFGLDILIWVAVVVGPFLLLALAARYLHRRYYFRGGRLLLREHRVHSGKQGDD